MFSPAVVDQQQAKIEARLGQTLVRHPHDQCWAMARQLADAADAKGNPLRALTTDESTFVLHEQLLCKIDYRYWSERWAIVAKKSQETSPLHPRWRSQEIFLALIAKLEADRAAYGHTDGVLMNVLKGRQLGLCLHPETRVLTAELRWVRLADLPVGAEIVATDEQVPGGRGIGRRMRTAHVEAKWDVHEPAFELRMSNGERLVTTGPHRWLCQKRGAPDTEWRHTRDIKIGDSIRHITQPWGEASIEDGWVGGMLDGEGSFLNKGAGSGVCIAQVGGAVYERVKAYLTARGYVWREQADRRKGGTSSKLGNKVVYKAVVQRMNDLFRLLGQTRPTRFIDRRWWEGKELPGKQSGVAWAQVTSITALPAQRMIDIQTSTKTFIAEGFVSHNSTESEAILAHRITSQTSVRGLVAGDVPEQSEYLFGMAELIVDALPWWMKPLRLFHKTGKYMAFATGTSLRAAAGKSQRGGLQDKGGAKGNLGRGKTFGIGHISEVSTWERPEQLRDGLEPGIPEHPRTFFVRESTAKGRNDFWHNEWRLADEGKGRWTNVFIPWYSEPSQYRLPPPEGWVPNDYAKAHAETVERTSGQFMLGGETIRLHRDQLYWWERKRQVAEDTGELNKFYEEMPATPEESFQHSGRSIFTPATLELLQRQERIPAAIVHIEPMKTIAEIKAWERATGVGASG